MTKPSSDLEIDVDALEFEIDEAVIEAKRDGGGEAIIPGKDDNNCASGSCIL